MTALADGPATHAVPHELTAMSQPMPRDEFPRRGMPAQMAYELIRTGLDLDGNPSLNLASFVTTWMEPEAERLIHDALRKNHIDHEEYPASQEVEQRCVRLLADLWNAPEVDDAVGVACIGSSEAIMLGLLAHKWTWRQRREAAGLPTDRPNVVFGAETHVVWDKFARYFDVEMRKIPMRPDRFTLVPDDVEAAIDENTIAVGVVLGTTHIGESDPVGAVNELLVRVKRERGWDIPIHVDGASGGFIAPFAHPDHQWDFRLEQVRSINASGHKYGLVYPGIGWLVMRSKTDLPADLIFSVNYLGGAQPTYTFNFSRGAAMIHAQYYQFIRLGWEGYREITEMMLGNARHLNEALAASGRFTILNPGLMEPIVTFSLVDDPGFDVFHLSERLRQDGWIVPAYTLPPNAEHIELLRVVCRIDMSREKVNALIDSITRAYDDLAAHPDHPPAMTKATIPSQHERC
ncbi:MAG: glutamate decarboxylase [Actinomycetota bacterium]